MLASPLFPHVTISLGSGPAIVINAPGASATTPYVQGLDVHGLAPSAEGCATASPTGAVPYNCPWLPPTVSQTGAQLDFTLGASPSTMWGSSPSDAPPSFPAS